MFVKYSSYHENCMRAQACYVAIMIYMFAE